MVAVGGWVWRQWCAGFLARLPVSAAVRQAGAPRKGCITPGLLWLLEGVGRRVRIGFLLAGLGWLGSGGVLLLPVRAPCLTSKSFSAS